jgi:hypothetical protein
MEVCICGSVRFVRKGKRQMAKENGSKRAWQVLVAACSGFHNDTVIEGVGLGQRCRLQSG